MPSLDDIQDCINKSAQAILGCFKHVRPLAAPYCLLWRIKHWRERSAAPETMPRERYLRFVHLFLSLSLMKFTAPGIV